MLVGEFTLVKQSGMTINDGHLPEFKADAFSLSMTASLFAGVGGGLSEDANSEWAVVTTNAVGFQVEEAFVNLVLVQNQETGDKYTGLQAGLTDVGLVGGSTDLELMLSGAVRINRGPSSGRLD